MRIEDKEIRQIEFRLNYGIGSIEFNMTEDEVVRVLGNPIEKEIREEEEMVFMHYADLSIYLHPDDNFLTVHPHKLLLGENLLIMDVTTEEDAINYINEYHLLQNIPIHVDYELDLDKMLFFSNLGLTIWLEDSVVNDISIEPINSNEEE